MKGAGMIVRMPERRIPGADRLSANIKSVLRVSDGTDLCIKRPLTDTDLDILG